MLWFIKFRPNLELLKDIYPKFYDI